MTDTVIPERALLDCADPEVRAEYEALRAEGFTGRAPRPTPGYYGGGNLEARRDLGKFQRAHSIVRDLDARRLAKLRSGEWYGLGRPYRGAKRVIISPADWQALAIDDAEGSAVHRMETAYHDLLIVEQKWPAPDAELETPDKKNRRPPIVTNEVAAAMSKAIEEGSLDFDKLRLPSRRGGYTEQQLVHRFGASRTPVREARKQVTEHLRKNAPR